MTSISDTIRMKHIGWCDIFDVIKFNIGLPLPDILERYTNISLPVNLLNKPICDQLG